MGLLERFRPHKPEQRPEGLRPKNFADFVQTLEDKKASAVHMRRWRIVRQNPEEGKTYEYGIYYFSKTPVGQDIFFEERFGRYPLDSEDLTPKTLLTAVTRIGTLEALMGLENICMVKGEYLSDEEDPESYKDMLMQALKDGIAPFPIKE